MSLFPCADACGWSNERLLLEYAELLSSASLDEECASVAQKATQIALDNNSSLLPSCVERLGSCHIRMMPLTLPVTTDLAAFNPHEQRLDLILKACGCHLSIESLTILRRGRRYMTMTNRGIKHKSRGVDGGATKANFGANAKSIALSYGDLLRLLVDPACEQYKKQRGTPDEAIWGVVLHRAMRMCDKSESVVACLGACPSSDLCLLACCLQF